MWVSVVTANVKQQWAHFTQWWSAFSAQQGGSRFLGEEEGGRLWSD